MNIQMSVVILNLNRKNDLRDLLQSLTQQTVQDFEVIIVDNNSNDGSQDMIRADFPFVRLICLEENIGITGRNVGMREARSEVIFTFDNDIVLSDVYLFEKVLEQFHRMPCLGSVGWKILYYGTDEICNWNYAYDAKDYADREFYDAYVQECAVAFRKSVLEQVGYYPEEYFISVEGLDLAYKIIDAGYDIVYNPHVYVHHKYSKSARKSWRFYYYDSRNHIWFAVKFLPWNWAIWHIALWVGFVFLHCLKDGYWKYYFRSIIDAIKGLPAIMDKRKPLSRQTIRKIRALRKGMIWI